MRIRFTMQVCAVFALFLIPKQAGSQCIEVYLHREISYPSIYLKTNSIWGVGSPIAFVSKRFSPDYGETWKHVGPFGSNLRPYVLENVEAKKYLDSYATVRGLGAAQMLLIAPAFLIKEIKWTEDYNQTGPPYEEIDSPGYIWGFFAFLYSGSITYHLIAKGFLLKSLTAYYGGSIQSPTPGGVRPRLGLDFDRRSKKPMLALTLNF